MRQLPLLGILLAVAARGGAGQSPDDLAHAFAQIHRTAAEEFLDAQMGGLDWEAVGASHAARAAASGSLEAFATVVNEMLGLLKTSHTRLYTDRESEYYQLLSIFRATLDEEIRAAHPDNPELRYPGIGAFCASIDGQVYVSGVLDGWPAADGGLRVGDRIIAVEGEAFRPVASFEGRVGHDTVLEVQRTSDPSRITAITVRPVMIEPQALFLRGMEKSIRLIERAERRIGYVRIWFYGGEAYHDLLRAQLTSGPLRDADALVIDVRGGSGGGNPGDLNMFNQRVPAMSHVRRDGERREIDRQWRKPVSLLIDETSRSGKEIWAYGFRKHGIGPVVGGRTSGAVVGGRPFLIRPGMVLYLAVLDVLVDGERLEGRGVTPDIEVPFELRYSAGADPRLEAAIEALVAGPAPK